MKEGGLLSDTLLPLAHAERYAGALLNARLVSIDDAYSFTPEGRPEAVAEAIRDFAG
jgi:pimeloyl-ACP methyl ester carboxylesterase